MKKWFLERFLPMWAKETVYKDNRRLLEDNRALMQENQQLRAYIRGLREGNRVARRLKMDNGQLRERIATGHKCPSQ